MIPDGQQSGFDGPTDDDVPMMQVGLPMPAPTNQATTKPRQLPGGGGGFDPTMIGGDVQEQRADGNDTETAKDDIAGTEPTGTEFKEGVVRHWASMVLEIGEANPEIDPRVAQGLATEAMADILRVHGYQYDPGAWTHDFRTSPSLLEQLPSDKIYDRVKDQAKKYIHGPRRPQPDQPEGQGDPSDPQMPDTPESRSHDLPMDHREVDDDVEQYQDAPQTMGEWARRQMDAYGPEARRDLWRMRHDPTPFPWRGPNGAPHA